MEQHHGLSLHPFTEQDIPVLVPIMKAAFDRDTQEFLGKPAGGPPGYDDGSFLRRWGLHPDSTAFTVWLGERLIGGIVLWINSTTHINQLGCVFLDPGLQDQGIGCALWSMVEQKYPQTRIWRTETPGFSRRNHHFYVNKCGFAIVKIDNPADVEERSFVLEKRCHTVKNT